MIWTRARLWTPTALPIRGPGTYVARHGFGYSRFQHDGTWALRPT